MVRDRIILGAALAGVLVTFLAMALFIFFALSAEPEPAPFLWDEAW